MEKEFFDFLRGGSTTETFEYGKQSKMIVNKIKYNDKLDIIYALDSYSGNLYDLNNSFNYGGIYDKESDKLFYINYSIRQHILNWDYDNEKYISDTSLYSLINKDINERIKELVEENKSDILNTNGVEIGEELEDKDVINEFMEGKTSKTLEDSYREFSTKNTKDLFDYLTDKKEFIEEVSREFVLNNVTDILRSLAISEEKRKILKMIEDNKEHPYHKIKNIIDSIKEKNCVTVTLTINKNGIEQTFKYNADTLKNNYNYSYLSTYDFEKSSERNLFEETFGSWDDLHYEDIVKITYGKNTIYEDDNFKVKEEEKCL